MPGDSAPASSRLPLDADRKFAEFRVRVAGTRLATPGADSSDQ